MRQSRSVSIIRLLLLMEFAPAKTARVLLGRKQPVNRSFFSRNVIFGKNIDDNQRRREHITLVCDAYGIMLSLRNRYYYVRDSCICHEKQRDVLPTVRRKRFL